MTSQVFYRKWRPQTLSEVFGQEHITQTLRNALSTGRISHAYLFCGPRGTGKTSTGRILAKAVNCLSLKDGEPCNACNMCQAVNQGRALDIIEIDAASNRRIEDVRDLREKVNYAPNLCQYKVYIIDEVHMLTDDASNALLKTLEEPPAHVIFVLATTEPHKVLPTILSRCQRFDFHRLSQSAVISKLSSICKKENIDIEPETLRLIARATTGSLRDAENLLEQLVAYFGHRIELTQAQAMLGISNNDLHVKGLVRNIVNEDVSAGLQTINTVNSDGLDLRQFNRSLVDCLRNLLLVKSGSEGIVDVTQDDLIEMKALAANTTLDHLLKAIKTFGAIDLRLDNYSTLPLELALVECLLPLEEKLVSFSAQPKELVKVPNPSPKPITLSQESMPKPEMENMKLPEEGVQDINYLRSHWKEFILSLRGEGSRGNLDALLRSACEPVTVEGDVLVLGFYYDYHKAKIEDPKYRHLIERKLKEVFGHNYQLRCILTSREEKSKAKAQTKNPLVRAALEMGAKIIDEES